MLRCEDACVSDRVDCVCVWGSEELCRCKRGVWDGMGQGGRRIIKRSARSGQVDAVRFGGENGRRRKSRRPERGTAGAGAGVVHRDGPDAGW